MKRSTWLTVVIFGALLAAWWFQSRPQTVDAPPPLKIDGYLGNMSAAEARTAAEKQPSPYDRIVIKRQGKEGGEEVLELVKDASPVASAGEGQPQPEAKWQLTHTAGGRTLHWPAQAYRAKAMAEALQRTLAATYAVRVDAKSAADYGLDAAHALDVALYAGQKPPVQLKIGVLQKAEREGEPTTWLTDPQHAGVAYQVVGRDVRSPFDVTLADLRERTILNIDLAAVDGLTWRWPGSNPETLIVSRPPQAGNQERAWSFVEPRGVRAGDVGGWLDAIGRLSATEFVAANDPAVAKAGFDDPKAPTLTISENGKNTVLIFGHADETRPNKEVWLKVASRDEVYRVAGHQYQAVALKLDQLRDRHLLDGHRASDLTAFTVTGSDSKISASLDNGVWHGAGNAEFDGSKASQFVQTLEGTQVDWLAATSAQSGLEHPEWTLEFRFPDGTARIILAKEDAGSVLGRITGVDGKSAIFKVSSYVAEALQKRPTDFTPTPKPETTPPD